MYLQLLILPGRVHAAFPVSTMPFFSTQISESLCTSLSLNNCQLISHLLSSSFHNCPSYSSTMHQMLICGICNCIHLFIRDIAKVYAHIQPAIYDNFKLLFVRYFICHFGPLFWDKLPGLLLIFSFCFYVLSLLSLMFAFFILFFFCVSTGLTDQRWG